MPVGEEEEEEAAAAAAATAAALIRTGESFAVSLLLLSAKSPRILRAADVELLSNKIGEAGCFC